jgi:hypothetical protein
MGDLESLLPTESKTVQQIYEAYKRSGDAEPARGYLGASIIGHPCARYLWYAFRDCCKQEFDGRMYRLFATGDLEEARFVADLRAIGCEVHDVDEHGNQFAVHALGGHFSGHMDGCALGVPEAPKTWHLLEFKTHNAKSFAKLKKEGVEKSNPKHYAQMQSYMHLGGLTRALYLARNKDTDELYAERIHYDPIFAAFLIQRAETIIRANEPPEKLSERADWYECQWCDAKAICNKNPFITVPVPSISCRQCCHATPVIDDGNSARWQCEKYKRALSRNDQQKACQDHLILPRLVHEAVPVDYGSDGNGEFITFQNEKDDGSDVVWQAGRGAGRLTSWDLAELPGKVLPNRMIATSSDLFGAMGFHVVDDILDRYPESDSRLVWSGFPDELFDAWRSAFSEPLKGLTPIARSQSFDHDAAEFEGGRVAILWHATGDQWKRRAEIRTGKE